MSGLHLPPHVLREYALIADGERGALIGPRGDISWLCLPRWHDDPVFSGLLGGRGAYTVTPVGRCVWGGSYEPGSLVWRSRWVVDDGSIIECREALALPADPRGAVLLRQVQAISGTARVEVALELADGTGARHHGDTWTGRTGPLRWRWTGAPGARRDRDGALHTELAVTEGDAVDLVLEIGLDEPGAPPNPDRLWSATTTAWAEGVPELGAGSAGRDAQQAYAVLRGLTSGSGGMVAAATTGLPERAKRHRSYDYRYVWIRDQCYAGLAAAAHGPLPALHDAVRFTTARLLEDGDRLQPAYTVDGGPVPDVHDLDHLPGYPGGAAVAGNRVNTQFQLDAVGELLQLLAAAARVDCLDADGWRAAQVAVDVVEKRWDVPDAGIWELDDDWWAQSRLAAVAGLRRIAEVAPSPGDAARAEALADGILAETSRRCLSSQGWWQRSPTIPEVDASLLLPPVRGALPANDPRSLATLAAVRDQLTQDGYVYRFRPATPLGEEEGAFLLCGFLLALAEHAVGDEVAAYRAFERTRAACGTPGLLAEEFDVRQRQLRGNLPQAFVHALLLECAATLP